jgi:hypothetical protein
MTCSWQIGAAVQNFQVALMGEKHMALFTNRWRIGQLLPLYQIGSSTHSHPKESQGFPVGTKQQRSPAPPLPYL